MARLNQIVAVVAGKKTRVEKEFGDLNKTIQKPDLFHGLNRQYQPIDENGESLPPEQKFPQKNVAEIVGQARDALVSMIDAVATQEYGNCGAKGDVAVDGKIIIPGVPVTVLLYLEKQLNDLNTFVSNIPTLDPSERWTLNSQTGQYVSDPVKTIRTKKTVRPLVLYPATPEHPAQTQVVTEDVTAGHWTTTKYATVMAATGRTEMLKRISKLQDAVKSAREEANSGETPDVRIAAPFLAFIFGN